MDLKIHFKYLVDVSNSTKTLSNLSSDKQVLKLILGLIFVFCHGVQLLNTFFAPN